MSIYDSFKPTYLYIKQHSLTGKLYFGKTIRNPETYQGSGVHWKRHIKKYGKEHVITLWYCLFLDQESCTEFALSFSKQQNIVESDDWLNLKEENGMDGSPYGIQFSPEHKKNISKSHVGLKRIFTNEHKNNISKALRVKPRSVAQQKQLTSLHISMKGRPQKPFSDIRKNNISISRIGKPHPISKSRCIHCGLTAGKNVITRYHQEHCKLKI